MKLYAVPVAVIDGVMDTTRHQTIKVVAAETNQEAITNARNSYLLDVFGKETESSVGTVKIYDRQYDYIEADRAYVLDNGALNEVLVFLESLGVKV